MHAIDLLKAVISGVVEGLTEFIPVSSTAHLLLFSWITEFNAIKNNLFEIVIQFGAILAVCIIYRGKIFAVIRNFHAKNQQQFVLNIFLAFLPAAALGLVFHRYIKQFLFSNLVIAIALIVGGIVMIIVDRKDHKALQIGIIDRVTPLKALGIGLFQSVAMIPGVSRSGATIVGGLLLGLDRKVATEFSFFLAIPTIGAASVFDLYKNYHTLNFSGAELILAGFLAAFVSAIFVIRWFINYVSKHSFMPFALYRIALGTAILFYIFSR